MSSQMHGDGLQGRTALLVKRLRNLLLALRDSTAELQEVTTAIETAAAEHCCALCGAPIALPIAPSADRPPADAHIQQGKVV